MTSFKHLYCKARMTAYVNGQLPLQARRRISRYMDECPACYAEYLRQRAIQQELMATLSTYGRPRPNQLARIWEGVQGELSPRANHGSSRPIRWRVGLATLAVLFLLGMPLVVGSQNFSTSIITPPTPNLTMVAVATHPVITYTGVTDETASNAPSLHEAPAVSLVAHRVELTPVAQSVGTLSPAAANTPDMNN